MTAPGETPDAAVMSRRNKIAKTGTESNGKKVECRRMKKLERICEKRQISCWQTVYLVV